MLRALPTLVFLTLFACGPAAPGRDVDAGAGDAGAPAVGDAGVDAGPWVRFVSPADGGTVANPVTFVIEAGGGVDEVQLFADTTWALGAAWDPATRSTFLYRFSGTGVPPGALGRGAHRGGRRGARGADGDARLL